MGCKNYDKGGRWWGVGLHMKGVFTGQGELAIPRKGSFFLARLVSDVSKQNKIMLNKK